MFQVRYFYGIEQFCAFNTLFANAKNSSTVFLTVFLHINLKLLEEGIEIERKREGESKNRVLRERERERER